MAFYTFCERIGGKIFHRYVDDNGRRHQEIVQETPLSLFIKGQGEYRSLFDDKLSKVEFESVREAMDFVKKYDGVMPVFGQTSPQHQFIANTYPGIIEFDFDKIRILNFDIETRFDGADEDELCRVRNSFGLEEQEMTVGEMRGLDDTYEVYDKVNDRWYLPSESPLQNGGGFPEAFDADYEVLTISCKVFGSPKKVTFGLKDYEVKDANQIYNKCEDEKDLLKKFLQFFRLVDPDIITGWNIEWFDIPYLVRRITKLLGEEMANKLSPFHSNTSKCLQEYKDKQADDERKISYRILGVTALDYYDLYRKYNPVKRDNYKLDYISEIELNKNKVDFSEFDNNLMKLYVGNFEKYVDYNEQDVYLVEELDDRKQFIRLAITTVLMTKSQYRERAGAVKLWDNLIYNMLRDDNIVMPPSPKIGAKEKIVGAYVKAPHPGKYRYVVSLDLTSLYPSICMMFNMSPETMVRGERGGIELVEALLSGVDLAKVSREKGLAMTANGAEFRLDKDGVLPRGMRYVFDTRKHYKDLMKVYKKEKEALLKDGVAKTDPRVVALDNKVAAADATQGAMKVLANSGYGVCANVAFRYFSKSIAEGITLTGQLVIQYIGNEINRKLNELFGTNKDYIITSDTDSAYLALDNVPSDPKNPEQSIEELDQFIEKTLQPFITEAFERLGKKMGAKNNLLDMKREALSDVGIWRAGKNYVLQVWDMEGVRYTTPELKMVGIETARSDKPMIVRKQLEGDLAVLLNGTEEQLLKRIDDFKKVFYNANVEEVAAPKGVSEMRAWTLKDGTAHQKAPWHTKAAVAFNSLLRQYKLEKDHERIRNGNKVKIFRLKKINPLHSNYIAFLNTLPKEMDMHKYLDWDMQWENMYISPLSSFTDILGWQTKKINTLESLFG